VNIVLFTKSFYGAHYSFYHQHEQHKKGIIIIESSSGMKQGDPLNGLLFALAHYQTFLKTIAQTFNCVFPSQEMIPTLWALEMWLLLPLTTFQPN